jgi:hypothetical protein
MNPVLVHSPAHRWPGLAELYLQAAAGPTACRLQYLCNRAATAPSHRRIEGDYMRLLRRLLWSE